MKRVVMFTNTFHPMVGGLERSVENAHLDLNRSGHFCRVVTPAFKGFEDSDAGVLRVPALKGVGERDFSIPLPATTRMQYWLEAIEPQVLHSHQPFLLGETAWRISQLRRIPLVFTHHTMYERYAHYLPMESERARRLVIDLTTRYANRCQIVVAPTDSVRRLLIERGVEIPVRTAASGIDWELYSSGSRERGRRRLGLAADDEVVGHLGRLSQEKNLTYLVEALIRAMIARSTLKLLLVGDGDRLEWAREHICAAGLGDRLVAPGMLSGQAVVDAYAAMDIFAFASHTDTQGLVLAEAMTARLCVVALDAPGARDCVGQDEAVVLPSDASPQEFAHALVELLADKSRRERLATNAYARSRQYGRDECLRRLVDIYGEAIETYQPAEEFLDDRWEQLAQRFDVEWTPFWEKVTSAFRALSSNGNHLPPPMPPP